MSEQSNTAPFADNRIAKFLTKRLDEIGSSKTYRQIAHEIGVKTPNIISMMKMGQTKVPLDRIPALARALNADPAELFKMALEQYWSSELSAIDEVFGTIVTANETAIIKIIREACGGNPPAPTPEVEEALKALFSSK